MKTSPQKLTHLQLARRAARTTVTELKFSLGLERHTPVQRALLEVDLREAYATVATLVLRCRRAREVNRG